MNRSRILLHLLWLVPVVVLALYLLNPAGVPSWDPRGRLLGAIPYREPSVSMSPTIGPGSIVVACTWAYVGASPERGDIIVFRPPQEPSPPYLKRVVGVAGDEVKIEDGRLSIGGELQNELYINPGDPGGQVFEAVIPVAHVFVAGDNRGNSYDSRHFGPVPTSEIIGKICGGP